MELNFLSQNKHHMPVLSLMEFTVVFPGKRASPVFEILISAASAEITETGRDGDFVTNISAYSF